MANPDRLDRLILPRPALAGCLFAAVLRDTRGRGLSYSDRFNHFPASPLCAVSWFFDGQSHAVSGGVPRSDPLPRLVFSGPQSMPLTSWNPGPVLALSLGFYPDAWQALAGQRAQPLLDRFCALEQVVDARLLKLFRAVKAPSDLVLFETALEPLWQAVRPPAWGVSRRVEDWSQALAVRAATSGTGRSLRQVQRRIRHWSGQNRRALSLFAQVGALEQLSAQGQHDLAGMAQAAGFSDQSHMGRALRRVTGISPAALNRRIAEDESFWVYRLLGERF